MVIDSGRVIAEGIAEELKRRLSAPIVEVRHADPAAAAQATLDDVFLRLTGHTAAEAPAGE